MKGLKKICVATALAVTMLVPSFSVKAEAATSLTVTTPSGYTCAEDVDYVKNGKYVANWGARGEDCTFLSTYAEDFYTGSYTYETLSKKSQEKQPSAKDVQVIFLPSGTTK